MHLCWLPLEESNSGARSEATSAERDSRKWAVSPSLDIAYEAGEVAVALCVFSAVLQ